MKRFTKRDEFGNADIIGVSGCDLGGNLSFEELNRLTRALNRLAELEDKLESGQLVELPCKVGDEIFFIRKNQIITATVQIVEESCFGEYNGKRFYQFYVYWFDGQKGHHKNLSLSTLNEKWFTDKSQAEARLKELKEE